MTTLSQTALTMTSREIAELIGKEHKHVLRDIRNMLLEFDPEGGGPRFWNALAEGQNNQSKVGLISYTDERGRQQPEYHLPKNLTLTLITGYSAKLRKLVIDRWQELEQRAALAAFNIPQTYPDALRLAADLTDKVAVLEHTVSEQAPKVQVYDRIVDDSGTYLVRAAAKVLGIGPRHLVTWLLNHGWAYRHGNKGHLLAYQDKLDRGWLAHKLTPFWNRRTQMNETGAALRVTASGLTVLTKQADAIGGAL